jgi:alanine racemase
MKFTSYIELSEEYLRKNIRYLKKRIGKGTKFVSVIKGNAYGHGLTKFVKLAEKCGIDHFAVSDAIEAEEALEVKQYQSHIMIMSYLDKEDVLWAVENDISFYIFDFPRLEAAICAAKILKKRAKIHIELETGFNRTGIEEKYFDKLFDLIKNNFDYIYLMGICTHYAGAESISNFVRINEQREKFLSFTRLFAINGIIPMYYHTASSAATLTYPDTIMDMVRIGIAQYGYWPSKETRMYNLLSDDNKFTRDPLHRILSWKSQIMSIKNIAPGQFVGYGNAYMASRNERIAIVPVGYSHGFSRSLSNIGHVLINHRKAHVVGMVNMNMMLVDITDIHNAELGDEVVMIGKQGKHTITVSSFSDLSKSINYETLTRLPEMIPRYIV